MNINVLNSPSKDRLGDWFRKQNLSFCFFKKHVKDKYYLKERGWEVVQSNGSRKHTCAAIIIMGKIGFKPNLVIRNERVILY